MFVDGWKGWPLQEQTHLKLSMLLIGSEAGQPHPKLASSLTGQGWSASGDDSTLIEKVRDDRVSFLPSKGAGKALILTPVRGSGENPGFS
jgi:hypothetical protein